MNQILYSRKNEQRAKGLALVFCILLALLIIVSVSFGIANKTSNKILKGVSVNGLDVGGLTKEEATDKLNEQLNSIKNGQIELSLGDYAKTITGEDLGVSYPNGLIDNAYQYGRTGNLIADNYTVLFSHFNKKYDVNIGSTIDESKFQEVVSAIREDVGATVKNDTYTIDGNKIVIEKGQEGKRIKETELENLIYANLNGENTTIEIPVEVAMPERIDFDKLYEETYVEKVDASYSTEDGFEYTQEVYGSYFDKEAAVQKYAELADGETMEIAMISVEPTVKSADLNNVLFKDVLATYQTKYDRYYTNRANNLEVAARNINGTILYPDEEFSYNKVVGERTVKNGFKEAHVFEGGKVVDGLGGGICQVSSTLYNSVLLSNLEVTQRAAHMMHTGYVEPGRDATVVYGSIDFKFKNNRKTPIKIETIVKNGICTATIYGIKEADDPKVEIKSVILKTIPYTTVTENDPTLEEGKTQVVQSPLNGYVSETYKILKDANGNEISNTLVSKDSYKQTSKIVKVGTKKVETPAVVEPTQEPTPENPTTPSLPTGWDSPESPYAQ
ncbi:MAG: VanW family protein [Clostridia bacterium]|nr:VanW family protein [Clostridia bacterium]